MSAETKACPVCNKQVLAVARKCRYCGYYFDPSARPGPVHGAFDKALLPVGRPLSAIAAGYCALFGIIPLFGLPFSIAAVICGIVALKSIKADATLSGRGRAWFGIIVGSIMILISIVMGIALIMDLG